LAGGWDASLWQTVPTSLLGDFGEFLGARTLQATLPPGSRVARVQRASWLKRDCIRCSSLVPGRESGLAPEIERWE